MENTELKKVLKFTSVLIVILCLFLVVKIGGTIKGYHHREAEDPSQNVITVSGRGEAFAVPDLLSFSFTVSEEAKTVTEAQDKATAKINSTMDILKKHNVEDKDIKTTNYNINPKYEYYADDVICKPWGCPPTQQYISGYEVSQTIFVKVRKTGEAGQIITDLGKVSLAYLSGLTFEIDDMEAIKAQARKLAIEDAKQKAEVLSDDLDVRLGKLISFSEQGDGYYPPMPLGVRDMAVAEEGKATPEIPAGENQVVSYVYLTYKIR